MANEIKLEVYTFRIRDKFAGPDKANFYTFGECPAFSDFLEFFKRYIESLDTMDINDVLKKAIKIKSESFVIESGKRRLSGVFESGAYGIEGDIYSLEDYEKKYSRQLTDVDIMPFYFLISVPKEKSVGILIIQRFGINGISTILKDSLKRFLKSETNDLMLEFSDLVSKELVKKFIDEGSVKEIIIRKYNLPSDKADKLEMNDYHDQIKSAEFRLKAKDSFLGINSRINKYLSDPNAKFFDIPELANLGLGEGAEYSVVSRHNGNTRTVDLSSSMQIRPYYDVDSLVQKEKNGFPVFESIDNEAKLLLEELSSEDPVRD